MDSGVQRPDIQGMSLPPGFLDELRTRLSLTDVVGRKVMWDTRKSNQAKGDMWAPCPFHQEKSASFHVDDRQGFYYCFGCHAKGDAISFVRETENVGFMEAIEILAGEAGMQMPARDPQAKQKSDRRAELANVMDEAVKWMRLQLKTSAGSEARAYLDRRGLSQAAQDRFEIGFSPDARQPLFQALTAKGIPAQHLIDSGLCAKADRGDIYDRFRGRIIYPIRDARGRCIGLGGRAMAADARAKYLNSPETELFDKGRSLYNHGPARQAAGKGQPLIVAEGYMDVIALVEAGFGATVAPLGTAITEDQLRLLWRISPEPIITLDGDAAGQRAALRLIDLALPLMEAGQSLRFCVLPEGLDPDDLLKSKGPAAMQELLDQAQPMVRLLWQRETEGLTLDSPERRAGLDKSLRAVLETIKDPSIRGHYAQEIKRLRAELFGYGGDVGGNRPRGFQPRAFQPRGGQGRRWDNQPAAAQASTKSSAMVGANEQDMEYLREAVILATLLTHPALLDEYSYTLEELVLNGPGHAAMAKVLLTARATDRHELRGEIEAQMGKGPLETLMAPRHVQICPSIRYPEDSNLARLCLVEELAKLAAARGAAQEVAEAMQQMTGDADESVTWRLGQAAQARHKAQRSEEGDSADFDIAPNGARIDRQERSAFDTLLRSIRGDSSQGSGG